jgi:hypothetical protein
VAIGDGRVYVGELDARLIALDQHTGKVLWSVQAEDPKLGYVIAMAPLYYGGLVITGFGGSDMGTRGRVKAYDARTGELRWTFYTVPGPGQFGHDTWPQNSEVWKHGGAAVWGQTPAVDPELGLIYFSSAGASHVADYVAHLANSGVADSGARPMIAGAILTSGFYDLGHRVSIWKDYYGSDVSKYAERSSLPGLLKTATPLLVTGAELDFELARTQMAELVAARAAAGKPVSPVLLPNHSHMSELYAVGTADESLSGPVLQFIRRVSAKKH